ncbi:MAG: T9SS type A sorting domain-containing protein [Chitinophagales bacterium]|nr:T9SS type A sorting domain-containing protein [Chitinophagales bacterium]
MKTITIILAIILFNIHVKVNAQLTAPSKVWDLRFGGSSDDYLGSLQQTIDGGYILGGFSESGVSGDKTEENLGIEDIWIVKIDSNGIKQWDKRYGGDSYEELFSLQLTNDGGYILGGWSTSGISGDKTQPSQGSGDYWIVKTDANGEIIWDKRFGGTEDDELIEIHQTNDEGYILGGWSYSGLGGDKTQTSQGGVDYWIVKIDANGIKQWDARFGGNSVDILCSLQQTSDGGYILGGYSDSGNNGDKSQASQGGRDYWIVKTDANGTKQWDARFGGLSYDWLSDIIQTYDQGYILGGWSSSGISGDKTQASQGSDDYWIVKTNENGIKQWDARFGGSTHENLNSLLQTDDGGYLLGGFSDSGISGDKTQSCQGNQDYWMVKTNGSGIKQWDVRFGGNESDWINGVQQIIGGGYILGGVSLSGLSGDKTQPSQGSYDYWIIKTTPECAGQIVFADIDTDGFGDSANKFVLTNCNVPVGFVTDSGDCDDGNASINPNATEIYNSLDDNCDGNIDEGFGPDSWSKKADFRGFERDYAVAFTIGDKGYAGTGTSGFGTKNYDDFWEYNPATDAWSQKANFGGVARNSAVGFSIGNKGYIGTGTSRGWGSYPPYQYEKDFWEYDPVLNIWTQKTDFGGIARCGAIAMVINNRGYIGTGNWTENDFWEYDPVTDTWTRKTDFSGETRVDAVAFSIGNRGYVGTGRQGIMSGISYKDFWEYNPLTDTWVKKADFGGSERSGAFTFTIGNKGYIGSGCDFADYSLPWNPLQDFWEYNPDEDTWSKKADFGGKLRGLAIAFSIGSKGYAGMGSAYLDEEFHFYKDFWEYTPSCLAGFVVYLDSDGDGYGDATYPYFTSECLAPDGFVYDSSDCNDHDASIPCICDGTNGIDDNCDGVIDDGFGTTQYFADSDGDGYGDPAIYSNECSLPEGYAVTGDDCNDSNPLINPISDEIQNGIDDNCDGTIDEGLAPDTWSQKSDLRGIARNHAVGFSIDGKGYMGTGFRYVENKWQKTYYKDFWEYDPEYDVWKQKADFGGGTRGYAVGFSIGEKGYIGTGYKFDKDYNEIYYKDFWQYDPILNSWTQKADFGGTARSGAVGFSIEDKGYLGTGSTNDFWEYDPLTDIWKQRSDFAGSSRGYAVGFSIEKKGYVGTGTAGLYGNAYIDFWEYDPNTDTWKQKMDFGGAARGRAVGFSIGEKGYIGTGFGANSTYFNDFWEYDPASDTWAQNKHFGGTVRSGAIGFNIGNKGYIGTGYMFDGDDHYFNDFWQYTPTDCNGLTVFADTDGDGFGDITGSLFAEDCLVPAGYVLNRTDCNDTNSFVHPGALELSNGIDDDCNGLIDDLPCPLPGNIFASNITAASATLSFDLPVQATSSKVRYKVGSSSAWTKLEVTGNSISVEGLSANTKYIWQVQSVCGGDVITGSEWSAKQHLTTALNKVGDEVTTSLELFPNPVSSDFTIDLQLSKEVLTDFSSKDQSATIYMLNTLGQVIYSCNEITGNGELTKVIAMPTTAASGWYVVRVVTSDQVIEQKLLYQK